ncbi:Aste57867_132 [Aphanomyces stellatus]|uniref:Aste57867_132 protein n=1 Tax=Aphanomyces stellatus TaxID=120398 RepID=A0A485K2Y1_9STRA|nr:hypothetical protein As57867_000132 [Aphanomyces stellatus]VFT77358.1 Aste57867_132 [Aphanomyces stellatus]
MRRQSFHSRICLLLPIPRSISTMTLTDMLACVLPVESMKGNMKGAKSWLTRNPFKVSAAKCHPKPQAPFVAPCCEKRRMIKQLLGDDSADDVHQITAAASVEYKIVNRAALRRHTAIVGSRRVPFYPMDNAVHRVQRQDGAVLSPIDEDDMHLCECCHHFKLNRDAPCVSITVL